MGMHAVSFIQHLHVTTNWSHWSTCCYNKHTALGMHRFQSVFQAFSVSKQKGAMLVLRLCQSLWLLEAIARYKATCSRSVKRNSLQAQAKTQVTTWLRKQLDLPNDIYIQTWLLYYSVEVDVSCKMDP